MVIERGSSDAAWVCVCVCGTCMYTELCCRYYLLYLGPSVSEVDYFKAACALHSAATLIELCLVKNSCEAELAAD